MSAKLSPGDTTHVVPEGIKRRPIDGVLKELAKISWGDARRLVETGKVEVSGNRISDTRHPVSTGETIVIRPNAPRPATRERLANDVIVHADPYVVVVRKPAGISTVPFEEGERNTLDQLVRALLTRERKKHGGRVEGTLGVVHRLDKETSGLLVFARTLSAKKMLAQQFREHTVQRRYLAIAHGDVTSRTFRSRLVADRGDGLRGSTTDSNLGVQAITHVEALEKLAGATLVSCRLETGRTHQIRIHLSEAGHPLVGERVYIRRWGGNVISAPRLMLHAQLLGFRHPHGGHEASWEEEPPPDFQAVLERLRKKA
jgi:23S rRNA pseudouridine1911/1915/1917 synthase